MDDADVDRLAERLEDFLQAVTQLSADEVGALVEAAQGRTVTRASLTLRPEFLLAVSSGRWSLEHDRLARHARTASRRAAVSLCPWRRRRVLAGALEDAALALLARHDALPTALRLRLAEPWRAALGGLPGEPVAA